MAESMTTSGMTDGQIDRACEIFRAKLTKHRNELPTDAVQQAFGDPNLSKEWLLSLRSRADAISDMIVRRVTVDGTRTPQAAIDATGRNKYVERDSIKCMPDSASGEMDVHFFKVDRWSRDADLEKEYELRGLVPNPRAQAAVNEADPAFADEYPNGTQWKDAEGNWHFATFDQWNDERDVDVDRSGGGWSDRWFVGGVRKV